MKTQIIKDLVKVADSLDRKGLYKESDMVDALIQKMAGGFGSDDADRDEGPGGPDFEMAKQEMAEAASELNEMLGSKKDEVIEKIEALKVFLGKDFVEVIEKIEALKVFLGEDLDIVEVIGAVEKYMSAKEDYKMFNPSKSDYVDPDEVPWALRNAIRSSR